MAVKSGAKSTPKKKGPSRTGARKEKHTAPSSEKKEKGMNWSIVDFHRLFVLPKKLVLDVAVSAGPRLRLEPPYREHLAQALARYFMRVGLPHDAKDFIAEGKIAK